MMERPWWAKVTVSRSVPAGYEVEFLVRWWAKPLLFLWCFWQAITEDDDDSSPDADGGSTKRALKREVA